MPGLYPVSFSDRIMNEVHYQTVPQTSASDRKYRITRGKWLGGCSVNNGMKLYLFCTKSKNYELRK